MYYPENRVYGRCGLLLCLRCKKDDRTFIVALLGSGWPPHKGYKWSDVQTLLDYGDKNYRYQTIDISKGVPDRQVHVMNGEHDFATVRAKQTNYRFLLSSEDKVHVESVLPGQLEAPVEAAVDAAVELEPPQAVRARAAADTPAAARKLRREIRRSNLIISFPLSNTALTH